MFENRALRKVLWARTEEVTGGFRKLHTEELPDLQSLPDIVTVIRSRRER